MAAPDKRTPGSGPGALEGVVSALRICTSSPARSADQENLVAQVKAAREQLDAGLEELEHIDAWARELRARLARMRLIFELVDCDVDFEQLQNEVAEFARVCRCLTWRPAARPTALKFR
jgi:hypothetical protein